MIKLLIGAVLAAVVVIVSFAFISPITNNSSTTSTTLVNEANTFSVSIEGEVSKSGTYVLKEGVTMADLISAAGGLTSNADVRTYNESYVLTSGTTYYIGALYDATDVCNSKEITKVNINKDDASTLMTINGFTSSISESVVSYRTSNGEFDCLEELMEVYGIGNATYRKVRNYIYLHEWKSF